MLIVEIAVGVVVGLWLFGAIGRWARRPDPSELPPWRGYGDK